MVILITILIYKHMAWTDLKAAVAAVIKTNGNQEITGSLLQSTLNSIIDQVGEQTPLIKGRLFLPRTPGTPDALVFYIASTQGTYANFGGDSYWMGVSPSSVMYLGLGPEQSF